MTDPLREWAREYREKLCSGDPTKTLLHFRADDFELELEKMGESLARRCAEMLMELGDFEIANEFQAGYKAACVAGIEAILREWGSKAVIDRKWEVTLFPFGLKPEQYNNCTHVDTGYLRGGVMFTTQGGEFIQTTLPFKVRPERGEDSSHGK